MSGHDVSGRLGEIGVPVTAVAGEQDMSVPLAALQVIAQGVAHGRLVALRGPHMLPLEEPGPFAAVLRDHLSHAQAGTTRRGRRPG